MKKLDIKEFASKLPIYLTDGKNHAYQLSGDKTYVLSNDSEFNKDYCIGNDIEILKTGHRGGTIVSSKDDMYFVVIRPYNHNFVSRLYEAFIGLLKGKGLNASYDGNDLLIDNKYKVTAASKVKQRATYSAVGFFFNVDIDMIKNICTKPMEKIPRGLDYYGIDKEEVIQFVTDFYKGWKAS